MHITKRILTLLTAMIVGAGQIWAGDVNYLDASGTSHTCATATKIEGSTSEVQLGANDTETWYYVDGTVDISNVVKVNGDVHLILCDNAKLNVTIENNVGWEGFNHTPAIWGDNNSHLTIYSQSTGDDMGSLTAYVNVEINEVGTSFYSRSGLTINGGKVTANVKIDVNDFTINGGELTVSKAGWGIYTSGEDPSTSGIIINGGKVTATLYAYNGPILINGGVVTAEAVGDYPAIYAEYGSVDISNGQVTATSTGGKGIVAENSDTNVEIRLGWKEPTDFITASSYYVESDGFTAVVKTVYPDRFVAYNATTGTAASAIFSGDYDNDGIVSDADLSAIAGKTLRPLNGYCVSTTDPNIILTAGSTAKTPDFTITTGEGDGAITTLYYICSENEVMTLSMPDGCVTTGYTIKTAAGAEVPGTVFSGTTLTMPAYDITVEATKTDLWGIGAGAKGTKEHPYTITTTDGLALLAKMVNGTNGYAANDFSGKYFVLGNDITYTHLDASAPGAYIEFNYTAIGRQIGPNEYRYFKGIFDGRGHTVRGIRIYKNGNNIVDRLQGLFGIIGKGGYVSNVTLDDARITGSDFIGGIVGENYKGVIYNCHVTENVCIFSPETSENLEQGHGGIVGDNWGLVSGCVSKAKVTAYTGSWYGGIVGSNYTDGTIKDCLYLGSEVMGHNHIGAVAGGNYGSIINCYFTLNIDGIADTSDGTATNVGLARTVTLGEGVTLSGTATDYGPASPNTSDIRITSYATAAGQPGFALKLEETTHNATTSEATTTTTYYSTSGATVALGYSGSKPEGYNIGGYIVKDAGGGDVNVTETDGVFSFNMPDENVTVSTKLYMTNVPYMTWNDAKKKLVDATTPDDTKVWVLTGGGATKLPGGWYVVMNTNTTADADGHSIDAAYTGGLTLTGETHLILADKAAMTCSGLSKYSSEDNLTIYGQSTGDDMGKLTATKADGCINVHNLAINGGEVTTNVTSYNGKGILADNVTINGGKVKAIGDYVGIWATNDFTISGGKVKAEGYYGIFAENTVSITGGTVEAIGKEVGIWATNDLTISGGQVKATCSPPPNTVGIFSYGDIHLGYTNADDYIFATSYDKNSPHTISVDATAGQRFVAWSPAATEGDAETASSIVGSGTVGDLNAINGKTLRPLVVAETGADGKVTTWPGYVVTTPARLTLSGKTDADGKPKPDFAIGSTPYYIYKKDATVTVASTGHDDDYAEFVAIDIDKNRAFYLNETAAKSHAFTMPGQDIKISSVRYYNLGVEYMNWDSGEPVVAKTDANTKVYVLDGTNGDLYEGWHVVKEDISYSDILQLSGDVHIILADGATMTIGTEDNPLYDLGMVGIGSYCPISIYGQSKGTGTLSISVSANYYAISSSLPINLYSCKLIISSCEDGISSGNKVGIYGCDVTMTNVAKDGIDLAYGRNLILRASSLRIHSAGNGIICADNGKVFYYGGQVDITGGASGNGISGNVTLCSWTSASDYFKASSYVGSMTIGTGYYFTYEGHTGEPLTGTVSDLTTIAGKKLVPAQKMVTGGSQYIAYCSNDGNWVLNDPNAQVYVITGYDLANGLVILTEVTGNEIPEGVPVIIGGASLPTELWLVGEEKLSDEAASSISGRKPYFFVCDGTTTVGDLLAAALGSTADLGDYVLFTLVNDGFRPVIATPTSTPAKGTCVLAIPKMELLNRAQGGSSTGARTLSIELGETDMRPTPGPSLYGGEWYDLQGRRLSGQPTAKGVYIHNGHAVVVQ